MRTNPVHDQRRLPNNQGELKGRKNGMAGTLYRPPDGILQSLPHHPGSDDERARELRERSAPIQSMISAIWKRTKASRWVEKMGWLAWEIVQQMTYCRPRGTSSCQKKMHGHSPSCRVFRHLATLDGQLMSHWVPCNDGSDGNPPDQAVSSGSASQPRRGTTSTCFDV
jgi:hypothetical protein